jgi:hypothetical protein
MFPILADLSAALDLATAARAAAEQDLDALRTEHAKASAEHDTAAAAYAENVTDKGGRELLKVRDVRDLLAVRVVSAERRLSAARAAADAADLALRQGQARAAIAAAEEALEHEATPAAIAALEAARDALAALDFAFAAELHKARTVAARGAVEEAAAGLAGARQRAEEAAALAKRSTLGAVIVAMLAAAETKERATTHAAELAEQDAGAALVALDAARDRLAALDPAFARTLPQMRSDEAGARSSAANTAAAERASLTGLRRLLAPVFGMNEAIDRITSRREKAAKMAIAEHEDAARAIGAEEAHDDLPTFARAVAFAFGPAPDETRARYLAEELGWERVKGSNTFLPSHLEWLRLCLTEGIERARQMETTGRNAFTLEGIAARTAGETQDPTAQHPIERARFAVRELEFSEEIDTWFGGDKAARVMHLHAVIAAGAAALMREMRIHDGHRVPYITIDLAPGHPTNVTTDTDDFRAAAAAFLRCPIDLVPDNAREEDEPAPQQQHKKRERDMPQLV